MKNHGIAKVELAVYDVGLRDSDGVLFVGAGVEADMSSSLEIPLVCKKGSGLQNSEVHPRGDEAKEVCPEGHLVQVPAARGKAYQNAGSEINDILA
ncbi:hypothetical protein Tco_0520325 [Tanacetum coccineum]